MRPPRRRRHARARAATIRRDLITVLQPPIRPQPKDPDKPRNRQRRRMHSPKLLAKASTHPRVQSVDRGLEAIRSLRDPSVAAVHGGIAFSGLPPQTLDTGPQLALRRNMVHRTDRGHRHCRYHLHDRRDHRPGELHSHDLHQPVSRLDIG